MADDFEDDDRGPNNTFDGLLRKLEDGQAVNDFGRDLQQYIRDLRKAAKRGGKRVLGKVTLELTIPMGVDGYIMPAANLKLKQIPKPARPESVIYTDEDGDINGLPVPKQMSLAEIKGGKAAGKDIAAPAVKSL